MGSYPRVPVNPLIFLISYKAAHGRDKDIKNHLKKEGFNEVCGLKFLTPPLTTIRI